jgi:hypothetical protein
VQLQKATYLHGEMRSVFRRNAASALAPDALFDFETGISSGAACGKVGVFCKNTKLLKSVRSSHGQREVGIECWALFDGGGGSLVASVMGSLPRLGSKRRNNSLVIERRPVKPALMGQSTADWVGAAILSQAGSGTYLICMYCTCASFDLVCFGGHWKPSLHNDSTSVAVSPGQHRWLQVSDSGIIFFRLRGSLEDSIILALGLTVAKSEHRWSSYCTYE